MTRFKISIITIVIFLFGIFSPTGIWGKGSITESYQELIRRNFTLRTDLKTIEKKYIALENERRVLILHVKELQSVKNSRSKVIQNLKNMIASLRIEMLKDPKLTRIIDSLNQRAKDAESQKDLVEEKLSQLESERQEFDQNIKKMETLVSSQKERDGKVDAELAKVKKEINASQRRIGNLESEKKALERKIDQIETAASKKRQQDRAGNKELVRIKEEKNLLHSELSRITAEKDGIAKKMKSMEMTFNKDRDAVQEAKNKLSKELARVRDDQSREGDRSKVALEKAERESKNFRKKNNELEEDLKMAQVTLKAAEKSLREELAKVQDLEKNFKDNTRGLKKELALARRSLDETEQVIKDMKVKAKKEGGRLTKEMKHLDREKNQLEKQLRQLEINLQKASGKNKKLDVKMARLKGQVLQSDKINYQLMRDFKKEQLDLQLVNKSLKKEKMRNAFERQHFEEQLKFAKADYAMFEAKILDLEQRTLIAETRRGKIEDELAREANRALLKESEVIALQEEKSKLEKKLIKYIEQAMDLHDEVRADSIRRGSAKGRGLNLRTKKQIAQQKLKMHYNMAIAYDKLKMYKEEEKEYRLCLRINSKDANVHYNLAILYDDKLNENIKAIRHYKKYLELHPIGEEVVQVKEWLLHAEQEDRLSSRTR